MTDTSIEDDAVEMFEEFRIDAADNNEENVIEIDVFDKDAVEFEKTDAVDNNEDAVEIGELVLVDSPEDVEVIGEGVAKI